MHYKIIFSLKLYIFLFILYILFYRTLNKVLFGGVDMPLGYGGLPQRVFRGSTQRWVPSPQEKIDAISGYDDRLSSPTTDPSWLQVVALFCDQCTTTVRQIARLKGHTERSHRREP